MKVVNEKLHKFHFSSDIIRVIKSRMVSVKGIWHT
jgi:hypothetical protein